ncbi:LOW QUALITY PROTEIN: hypothetical protein PHMEG_00029977 [Phytophthora megakarya]|uniref:Retrotransposon gag domain-containing protein n=1 Tax=Phytophthora megakarya TaxID=4795 RepID=A0A225V3V3_9STRA|nr:LOW QUALITY PROTEIN: hypothetical protein PHMEG_00029977 [Phytophthora megakarya]
MAKGSNSTVPVTPVKTGGTDDYGTEMLVETPGTDEYTRRSVSFEEDAHESMEEDYDLEERRDSGGGAEQRCEIRRAVWVELSHELAVAVTATTTGQVANETVQFLKSMGLQAQAMPTQAVLESWIPAEAGADLWNGSLRISFGVTAIHYPQAPVGKTAGGGVAPSKIPLPKTLSKRYNTVPKSHGVFSKSGDETPYFQDSHMITPRSSGRKSGHANATRNTIRGSRRRWDRNRYDEDKSSSDEDEDLYWHPQQYGVLNEYIRHIEKASSPEGERLTQKIELATHRPLGQIRAFSGLRNKTENSMQWLRGFVYEMEGTHASPDEWCMPFQLSLKDGALHWPRQLPKKTKRRWSLLSSSFIRYYCAQYNQTAETRYYSAKREDKEHFCDYLNRLNWYTRNAGIQFDKGGRKARDHVKRFLETCGDRGLERRLCHVKGTTSTNWKR